MSQHGPLLTEAQLANICAIDQFPDLIQDEALDGLERHYKTFLHGGDLRWAERDIQNTACLMLYAVQGQRSAASLAEHCELFGEESAQDVERLLDEIQALLQTRKNAYASEMVSSPQEE
jgi:hypothetical protein